MPFGRIALILALVCTVRGLLLRSATSSTVERVKSGLSDFAIMLWCIALAIMLAHYQLAKRFTDELSLRDGRSLKSQKCRSIWDWISRADVDDHDGPRDGSLKAGSIYFKGALGPSSRVPTRSSTAGSSLSLSPNASSPDARRSARLDRVLHQWFVSFGQLSSDEPSEDTDE